jgi:hypothetical protein
VARAPLSRHAHRQAACNARLVRPRPLTHVWRPAVQVHTNLHMPLACPPPTSAFGTSVGSRTLKLWSAVLIAAVFEFLGAMLLGGNVTRSIAGSIANTRTFAATPAVFMFGALQGVRAWAARSAAQGAGRLAKALGSHMKIP